MESEEIIELWEESEKEWEDIVFLARQAKTDTETIIEVLRREGIRVDKMNEEKPKAIIKKPLGNMSSQMAAVSKKEIPDVVLEACNEKINALRASISTVELQIKALQEFMEQGA